MKARLSTDGGARGNPGPAAYGYVLEAEDGTVLAAHGEKIGVATNNVAEYSAVIAGLRRVAEIGARTVHVRSDSKLLIEQLAGRWKIKNPGLKELHKEAIELARAFDRVTYEHVRREKNVRADELVNLALDGLL